MKRGLSVLQFILVYMAGVVKLVPNCWHFYEIRNSIKSSSSLASTSQLVRVFYRVLMSRNCHTVAPENEAHMWIPKYSKILLVEYLAVCFWWDYSATALILQFCSSCPQLVARLHYCVDRNYGDETIGVGTKDTLHWIELIKLACPARTL